MTAITIKQSTNGFCNSILHIYWPRTNADFANLKKSFSIFFLFGLISVYPRKSAGNRLSSVSMRRPANMNMRAGRGSRYGGAERQKGDAVATQKVQQRLSFCAIRMQRDIQRVLLVQSPTIMNRALTENCDRQRLLKSIKKKTLHFP